MRPVMEEPQAWQEDSREPNHPLRSAAVGSFCCGRLRQVKRAPQHRSVLADRYLGTYNNR